jgi:hypothetical protein
MFPLVLECGTITYFETALYPENLVSFEKNDVKKADFFQELNIFFVVIFTIVSEQKICEMIWLHATLGMHGLLLLSPYL